MIEISLSWALLMYSVILSAGGFALWLYTELTERKVHRVLENQHLWRCTFCAFVYLDEEAQDFSECPRCHSLNRIDDANVKPYRVKYAEQPVDHSEGRKNTSKQKRGRATTRGPRRRGGRR
ncbi:MAG: hypothetical protein GC168_07665 [Candidatus Hydrogenedens sp.]|nr:hypothetical protein [Candidatus Hydrogenedens sp.]